MMCIYILYIYITHISYTHTPHIHILLVLFLWRSLINIDIITPFYRWKKMKLQSPTGNKGYTSRWFLSDFMSGTYHWHLYDVPFPLQFIFGRERKKGDVHKGKSVEKGKESWGERKRAGSIDSHKVSSLSFLKMS